MNIAITGASGHIGHCLCKALIKRGDMVKVLLRRYDPSFANSNIECIRGNILKPETLSDLCQNTDVLIHLAAQISIDNKQAKGTHQTNVIGTQNILKASLKAGVKKFIHFSSINAFSLVDKGQILQEDIALTDSKNDIYAYSKAESEREVMKAIKKGLNAVILCPTGVFGPDDFRHSFLGQAIKGIYLNKYPMLIKGGFNWVDVRDVVQGTISSIKNGRSGQKYILSGHHCSLKDVAIILQQLFKRKTPSLIAPIFLAKLSLPFIQAYANISNTQPLFTTQSLNILINSPRYISNQKAQLDLGFMPRPFKESLQDTINWYQRHKQLK